MPSTFVLRTRRNLDECWQHSSGYYVPLANHLNGLGYNRQDGDRGLCTPLPFAIFRSESGNKVVARDSQLANAIGLHIQSAKNLPDIILVDLGPAHPLLVFVEVVATDGPIGETRKAALLRIAEQAGFAPAHVAFVTAYLDRSASAFRKTVDALAWDSFAWFMSEPDHLLRLYEGGAAKVRRLSDWG